MQGVKINQVEFNIGLNNNIYNENEVRLLLKNSGFNLFETTPHFVSKGEWKGFDEPTLVICVSTTMNNEEIIQEVEGLCKLMSQQAISILINNSDGHLVYHPHYEKQKLSFDKSYFIDAYEKSFAKNFK